MDLETLTKVCKFIRYDILTSTTAAASGHPTSSLSAVELMTVLFFTKFFNHRSDKFILSKGHASPLLYSIYHAEGAITDEELMSLRKFGSPFEGHPTPRLSFVDVATGSLGQGLSAGVGMALGFRIKNMESGILNGNTEQKNLDSKIQNSKFKIPRVYVLLGDSEMAEGQVWEAMAVASYYKLNNLIAILDVNRLGQRGETMLGWDIETYARRAEAFGWNVITVDDGHNLEQVYNAFLRAGDQVDKPTIIIAKTIKGKGVSFLEDQDGWHGKTLNTQQLKQALRELSEVDLEVTKQIMSADTNFFTTWEVPSKARRGFPRSQKNSVTSEINYKIGDLVATRKAYGDALVELGNIDPSIVALDAEVSNSTFSNMFQKTFPDRFFEMFIAEQNMVSTALGLSKVGFTPFVSTFAAFFTRTLDQIRMIELSCGNVKFCGSHAGVYIGADGPSQMGLVDLAMFRSILNSTVLYPADAVATFKLAEQMLATEGIVYLRTNREKTPVIYKNDEKFTVGGSKILRQSQEDKAVVFATGITLHESLKAYATLKKEGINIAIVDLYSIKPIDSATIQQFSHLPIIVVEDHYPAGGLGEAVLSVLNTGGRVGGLPTARNEESTGGKDNKGRTSVQHLAVNKIPRSGRPEELLRYEEIDAEAIIKAIRSLI